MARNRQDPEATCFLNVDLDIRSKRDLQPLVTALGKKVIALYVGRVRRAYHAHLELATIPRTADATIRDFCALIRRIPKTQRDLWDTAKAREFNIGVQAGMQPFSTVFALSADTIAAASRLGSGVVFTVYAPEEPAKPNRQKRSSQLRRLVEPTRIRFRAQ